MTYSNQHEQTLYLDAEGRLLLPDSIRQELGLAEGDRFILSISETGVLQLTSLKRQVHSLRGILTNPTPAESVVDELIQERRRSAAYE
jgi:bifunctional DNA-binding transcriptional regulator/antitoxin component of YhaV-PrlF toxin-antitoxin module